MPSKYALLQVAQTLDYLGRRLKGMSISADMLAKQGYKSQKEFLDTYGYQTFIIELKEAEVALRKLTEE